MNWLTIIVLLVWALIIFRGFRRGFIRTLISTVFLILVLIVTIKFSPKLRDYLMESQNISAWAQTTCKNYIDKQVTSSAESGSYGWLGALPLPDVLTENLREGGESIVGTLLQSDTVRTYLSEQLAPILMLLIAGVITFIASTIILGIISHYLNKLARLPGVRVVNAIFGLLLGFLKGLLLLWIFFIIVRLFSDFDSGSMLTSQINSSVILKTLSEHNLLLSFLPSAISGFLKSG